MSLVFIGTPEFAVPSLQRLAADRHAISAVVTQPDRPAGRGRRPRPSALKLAAQQLGVPIQQPPTLRDPVAVSAIARLKPQVIVAVAYGQILRQDVLEIPSRGVLNVHPSLLPRWRGASPIPAAILADDAETGCSIILMDTGMDSGPILAQERVTIQPSDNTGTLGKRLASLSADLLGRTLPRWLEGEIEAREQNRSQVTTCPLLRKEDGLIHWTKPAVEIWREVRAYNPWPGAHTTLDSDLLQIWETEPLAGRERGEPGTVTALRERPEELAVQTGDGLLLVKQLQRAGRRSLSAAEFLRGMPGLIGKRLGAP